MLRALESALVVLLMLLTFAGLVVAQRWGEKQLDLPSAETCADFDDDALTATTADDTARMCFCAGLGLRRARAKDGCGKLDVNGDESVSKSEFGKVRFPSCVCRREASRGLSPEAMLL